MLQFLDKINGPELLANTEITISVSELIFIDTPNIHAHCLTSIDRTFRLHDLLQKYETFSKPFYFLIVHVHNIPLE